MRVLGIDCGSVATGYGVVESDGHRHRALACGTIRLAQRPHKSFAERLDTIHVWLDALILEYHPDCVAIEDVFHAQNARSALKLAHVRGVAMQTAAAHALPVAEYTPLAVKSAVTGYGRAEKSQVQQMVRSLLHLDSEAGGGRRGTAAPDSFDASDALAVAICHLHTAGAQAAAVSGS